MSALQLLEAFGSVDDDLLVHAREPRKARKPIYMSVLAAAASLCVIALGAFFGLGGIGSLNEMLDPVVSSAQSKDSHSDYDTLNNAADSSADSSVNSSADHSNNSGGDTEHKEETFLTSGSSVQLSITQWNHNGFEGVVCNENSAMDYGTAVNVILTEKTICKMPVDQEGNLAGFDMNVTNSGVGTEVLVLFQRNESNGKETTVYADTVISYVLPVHNTGKEPD